MQVPAHLIDMLNPVITNRARFQANFIIDQLTKELLDVTTEIDGPVWWWPAQDHLTLKLQGNRYDFGLWSWRTKRALKKHFDGHGKEVIFPIKRIKIFLEGDDTIVSVIGNPDRANEVPSGQGFGGRRRAGEGIIRPGHAK